MAIPRLRLIDPEELVSLEELTTTQCRYPVGDPFKPGFGFCGKPVIELGESYCHLHDEICHTIPHGKKVIYKF